MAQQLQRRTHLESSRPVLVPPLAGQDRRHRTTAATVFRLEARRILGSFRFHASAFLLLVLMTLAAVTAAARYRVELVEQAALADDHARQLAGTTLDDAAEVLHPAVKPPWRLALLVAGGQEATPDVYSQAPSAFVTPELRRLHTGNPRLPSPAPLDWMFAIRCVLSLAAFLLGHDAVCGERRAGTLKLLLSYPVPRWKVLTGKLLAVWGCLALAFLAGALLSLLLAAGPGGIPLDGTDLAKAGLVVLLGLWAAAFFVLVALLVSSLTREPSASLGVLAWLWVSAVIVVPAVAGLLAHRLDPLPTESEIGRQLAEVRGRVAREFAGREGHWRPLEWAAADGFAWERASAEAENRRQALEEEVRRRVIDGKLGQARLARSLASLSPTSLIEDLAERLTGSGLLRDASFLAQARAYHSTLADRVRALDAADPESPHILFFTNYLSRRPLAPGALPVFTFQEQPVPAGTAAALPLLLVLAVETFLLAAAALLAFARYDAG